MKSNLLMEPITPKGNWKVSHIHFGLYLVMRLFITREMNHSCYLINEKNSSLVFEFSLKAPNKQVVTVFDEDCLAPRIIIQ